MRVPVEEKGQDRRVLCDFCVFECVEDSGVYGEDGEDGSEREKMSVCVYESVRIRLVSVMMEVCERSCCVRGRLEISESLEGRVGEDREMPPWDQDAEPANNPGESNLLHHLRWLLERD
ncbi:hypothetical protein COLO4_26779 [Corchorus olitorius]|uniref:Uncharacterized protein n=1 Tax=Corchorus olitorius TaxID=93759 RepID=A0A1R3HU81_9ROSI|nr:hypothetical protein COLO4_26779 [Corchorus olitorius]